MKKIIAKGLALSLLAVTAFCYADTNYSQAAVYASSQNPAGSGQTLALAEGKESSFLVTADGVLWSIGKNERGQLGTGDFEDRDDFVAVLDEINYVSAGYEHTAAVNNAGQLYLWGSNEEGQLGSGLANGQEQSRPLLIMEDVNQVAAGGFHTLAVTTLGELWAWGSNASGALGTGAGLTEYKPVKVLEDVKLAGAGWYYSAALKEDGSLWTWGWNEKGRLGTGSTKDAYLPVKIMENVQAISLGPSHGLALKTDGTLWAWGDNGYGQLGDGTTEHRYEPVMIMDNVITIAAGYYSSAAIRTDHSLWVWGTNKGLWLGREGKEFSSTPIQVQQNVLALALGRTGCLVMDNAGMLYLNSINRNQTAEILETEPVLISNRYTVQEHNERVYYNKRADEQALSYYLQPTESIQSDDPQIQQLAAEITAGLQSDAERLQAIHDWVADHLYYNYDAYYNGASRGDITALGALSEEATICSGFSNLTAALLRASGIPAKYISGYATSRGSGSLQTEEISLSQNAHAWNEAWIDDRWVIVDVTWDCKNRYQNGSLTSLPFSRDYLDMELKAFSYTHMIKEYTEYLI